MRLMHNLASLNIYSEQTKVLQKQSVALGRISSGIKVMNSKDDPNALAQSERLRIQIRGLQAASKNSQDGVSMMQTADGALTSITNALQRIRELTVQAGGDTSNTADKTSIKIEIDQMLKSIDDSANNMEFNGIKLLANNPAGATISMAAGANVGDNIDIPLYDLTTGNLKDKNGRLLASIDVTQPNSTGNDLNTIDDVLTNVLSVSSKYGSLQNRFDNTYSRLNELSDRMEGSDSSLRDADVADEMLEYSKDNILYEAGTALMAQTNKLPQDILRVLQNMR